MESFEELGLSPELVEGLAAEGIEVPTSLQSHAIPVLSRGNSVLLRAGPGSGVLAAWAPPILEQIEAGGRQPRALVLCPSRDRADGLATSLARLATVTGHRIAALGAPWALPALADVLVGTPEDLLAGVGSAEVKLDGVGILVLDGAALLLGTPTKEALGHLLDGLPHGERQWIVVADPLGPEVKAFAEGRLPRGVTLPPEAAAEGEETSPVKRGELQAWSVDGGKDEALLALVDQALGDGHRHVLLFFRSDDRAADGADLLALHGFMVDAPGVEDAPVWLGSDPLTAREAAASTREAGHSILVASVDVPPDADTLDRRHGGSSQPGVVLVHPRELPHLERAARGAGYSVTPRTEPPSRDRSEVDRFRQRVEEILEAQDLAPHLVLLEPLLERWGSARVAAALAALLRTEGRPGTGPATSAPRSSQPTVESSPPTAWVKVFLSIGRKDGVGPGDLVGAITGEAGVEGHRIGRIEIRETFSRVDIQEEVAGKVIQALNGVSIRGRSVRADYDRAEGRSGRPAPGREQRGGRRGAPRREGESPGRGEDRG